LGGTIASDGMGHLSNSSRGVVRRAGPLVERRREPRYATHKLVRVVHNMGAQRVWVIQCSARGVAILSRAPMQAGEQFMIQLQLGALTLLVYVVRFCREERKGIFRVGGELVRVSAPGQVSFRAILDALLPPSSTIIA